MCWIFFKKMNISLYNFTYAIYIYIELHSDYEILYILKVTENLMRNYFTISKNSLKLFCDFQTQPFLFPVNSKVVPDYHRIVKKPMDLQSIREVSADTPSSYPQPPKGYRPVLILLCFII